MISSVTSAVPTPSVNPDHAKNKLGELSEAMLDKVLSYLPQKDVAEVLVSSKTMHRSIAVALNSVKEPQIGLTITTSVMIRILPRLNNPHHSTTPDRKPNSNGSNELYLSPLIKAVEHLEIDDFASFESCIPFLPHLHSITIKGCTQEQIDLIGVHCPKLEVLNAPNSSFTSIPESLKNSLNELGLSDNRHVTEINLPNIKTVSFYNCSSLVTLNVLQALDDYLP